MTYKNNYKRPEISLTKPLKQVDISRYIYTVETAAKELYSATLPLDISGDNTFIIEYSAPATSVTVSCPNRTIKDFKAYANSCVLVITNSGYSNATVTISGQPLKVTESVVTITNGNTGEVQTVKNSLINSLNHATAVGNWVKDRVAKRKALSSEWRSDPRLDVGDIVKVKNDFGEENIRVTSLTYNFNGAFNGTYDGKVL